MTKYPKQTFGAHKRKFATEATAQHTKGQTFRGKYANQNILLDTSNNTKKAICVPQHSKCIFTFHENILRIRYRLVWVDARGAAEVNIPILLRYSRLSIRVFRKLGDVVYTSYNNNYMKTPFFSLINFFIIALQKTFNECHYKFQQKVAYYRFRVYTRGIQ